MAATLPMSTAMQVTGGAELLANALVTTVPVAPIALQTALTLGIEPEAMMMAATARRPLFSPLSPPTNTLVFEVGGCSWDDYPKVDLPLLLLVPLVSPVVVPLVWPQGRAVESPSNALDRAAGRARVAGLR